MIFSSLFAFLKKLKDGVVWILQSDSLPPPPPPSPREESPGFVRQLFSGESLEEKPEIKEPDQKGFFRWLISIEPLEDKPVLQKNQKGFLRHLFERERLE